VGWSGWASETITRPQNLTVSVLLVASLSVAAAPWLISWIGLCKIEGRPRHATHTVTADEVDNFCKRLRISQPIQIDPISPYSYILILQGARGSESIRTARVIARSHNVEHLSDHRYWHLSGAALTIWPTCNWTPTELIARAVELENRTATSTVPR
jgi:hypothetical protein